MAHGSFSTAINYMDGRTQLPINEYLRSRYNLDFINTVMKIDLVFKGLIIEYG